MLVRAQNPEKVEHYSDNLRSFRPRRRILAAILMLVTIGIFAWPAYGPQTIIKYAMIKQHTNTVLILNQEPTIREFFLPKDYIGGTCSMQPHCKEIRCFNVASLNVQEYIKSKFKNDCDAQSVNINLEDCRFPLNTLSKNWLETDLSIEELTIKACSLNRVEDDAFSMTIYAKLNKLVLINNRIAWFNKTVFRHLPSLESLVIENNIIERAESNLLGNVRSSLKNLDLPGSIHDTEVLRNITGGNESLKVELLSLKGNLLYAINKKTFVGVPKVKSLYIQNSEVKIISKDAFEPMANSIEQIFLNDNRISSLPEGFFDFALNRPNFRISIDNNSWKCDCSLQWMQIFIRTNSMIFLTMPKCDTPKENAMKGFNEANFCARSTEPEAEKTTMIPTTKRYEETTKIGDCIGRTYQQNNFVSPTFASSRKLLSSYLGVAPRFLGFEARNFLNGTVLLCLPNMNKIFNLIWFDSNDVESVNYARDVRKSYFVQNLKPRTTYVICLLSNNENTVSPLNCLAETTSLQFEEEQQEGSTWLTNDSKATVFSLIGGTFILMFFLSALLTVIYIRRYPSLLRGSRRVLFVKHRDVDAIILPKGVRAEDVKYSKNKRLPSLQNKMISIQEDGYVTPLPPSALPTRRNFRSSTISFQSEPHSYASVVEPNDLKSELYKGIQEAPPLPPQNRKQVPSLSLRVDSRNEDDKLYPTCTA